MGIRLIRPVETVTMIGMGASVYDWVSNVHDEFLTNGEIWTINSGAALFRHDYVFDMHTDEWIAKMDEKTKERAIRRREWLVNHDRPIIMPKAKPELPTSITFPLGEVIELTKSVYFATGASYMLALAYVCDVKYLKLFGCDFSYDRNTNTHDEQGRACAEYWIGRLVQRGTKVATPTNSHLMDGFRRSQGLIYGYHERVAMDFPTDEKGGIVQGAHGKFVGPNYTGISHAHVVTGGDVSDQ